MEEPFIPACAKPREIANIKFLPIACLKKRNLGSPSFLLILPGIIIICFFVLRPRAFTPRCHNYAILVLPRHLPLDMYVRCSKKGKGNGTHVLKIPIFSPTPLPSNPALEEVLSDSRGRVKDGCRGLRHDGRERGSTNAIFIKRLLLFSTFLIFIKP